MKQELKMPSKMEILKLACRKMPHAEPLLKQTALAVLNRCWKLSITQVRLLRS